MLAAILVTPLIYFVNAFLLGRHLKRLRISINPFLSTLLGFIFFLDVFYVFDVFLYTVNANVLTYLIIYCIIQAGMIVSYIVNWKYIFIKFSFDLKKLLTFLLVIAAVILIAWGSNRDIQSQFGLNWVNTVTMIRDSRNLLDPINFRGADNDIISNLSAINIFNVFWVYIFKIISYQKVFDFYFWSWTVIAAIFVACLATWIIPERCNIARVIVSPLICIVYVLVLLAFIENFAIGDAWLSLFVLFFILLLVKQPEISYLKLTFLTITMIGFVASTSTSFYITIGMWLFAIYWAIRNKENSINYAVCLSWPLLLSIFGIVSIYVYWLLSVMDAVALIFMFVILVLFAKNGTPAWSTKFARRLAKNSGKIVYTAIGIIIAFVLIANFFIFNEFYRWQISNMDYKNFLSFTYRYLWNIKILKDKEIFTINMVLYAFFLGLIIAFVVLRNLKKSKLYPIVKTDSAIKLAVSSAAIFINPLVIHVLKFSSQKMEVAMPLNTINLNLMFVAPLFVALLKLNFNLKARTTSSWAYDWY